MPNKSPDTQNTAEQHIGMYGADCAGWLARWDAGQDVWSIAMAHDGASPEYELGSQAGAATVFLFSNLVQTCSI